MSWTVIKDLKEKRAKAFADAQSLRDLAHKEERDLNADEQKRHEDLLSEVENYRTRIEREEKANALGELIAESRNLSSANSVAMPQKDFKRYSLLRAVQLRMNNQQLDGVEAEVSAEIARRSGKAPQGFYVPMESRAFDLSAGTGSVGVDVKSDLIELLRNKTVLSQMGATVMSNMNGKFSIPRQSGAATAYWLAESGSPTASAQTIDQVAFTPKTVGAYTDISRSLVTQSSLDAEALVRNDLARVLANAIDLAGIHGTGASNQPTGITVAASTGSVSHGTNGGAPTWAKVVEFEKTLLTANIDPSSPSIRYLTNAKVATVLKTTDKTSGGYGQFILDERFNAGKLNGYPLHVTNAVKSDYTKASGSSLSGMILGNFSDLCIAFWGGLDMLVDPYTGSSSGTVRIVVLQDCDIELRHPESFVVAKDIIA